MPLKIKCPKCQKSLTVPDNLAGRTGKCPKCGVMIPIHATGEREPIESPASSTPPPPPVSVSVHPNPNSKGSPAKPTEPAKAKGWVTTLGSIGGAVLYAIGRVIFKRSTDANKNWLDDVFWGGVGVALIALVIWGLVSLVRRLIRLAVDNTPVAKNSIANPAAFAPPPPPSNIQSTADHAGWWLHFAGQVSGPCSTEALLDSLRCGDVLGDTPACPVGSTQWQPITAWPEFAGAINGR